MRRPDPWYPLGEVGQVAMRPAVRRSHETTRRHKTKDAHFVGMTQATDCVSFPSTVVAVLLVGRSEAQDPALNRAGQERP